MMLQKGHLSQFSPFIFSQIGGMDGKVVNNDVRIRNHQDNTYRGHNREICILKWSGSGKQLASGGILLEFYIWLRAWMDAQWQGGLAAEVTISFAGWQQLRPKDENFAAVPELDSECEVVMLLDILVPGCWGMLEDDCQLGKRQGGPLNVSPEGWIAGDWSSRRCSPHGMITVWTGMRLAVVFCPTEAGMKL